MDSERGYDPPADPRATILLVEDDPGVAMTLTDVLEADGYAVAHAKNATMAKSHIDEVKPDLILLDLMLPDADGLVLCADLKSRRNVPIIICSATNRKRDAVLGFKLGADDFVPKPFHVDELLTRIQAALRRSSAAGPALAAARAPGGTPAHPADSPAARPPTDQTAARDGSAARTYRVGALVVDHSRRDVRLGNVPIELTPTEYRLIAALAARAEEVLSRQELAQIVWGYQDASIGRSIDVHLHRLRTKLREADTEATPPHIVSVRGFGYRITADDPDETINAA